MTLSLGVLTFPSMKREKTNKQLITVLFFVDHCLTVDRIVLIFSTHNAVDSAEAFTVPSSANFNNVMLKH